MRHEMSFHILEWASYILGDVSFFGLLATVLRNNEMALEALATCGVAENNSVRYLGVVCVRSENHSERRSLEYIWCHLWNAHQSFVDYIQKGQQKEQFSSTNKCKMSREYKLRHCPIPIAFTRPIHPIFLFTTFTKYFFTIHLHTSLTSIPLS
jgi:hypothetical protein